MHIVHFYFKTMLLLGQLSVCLHFQDIPVKNFKGYSISKNLRKRLRDVRSDV